MSPARKEPNKHPSRMNGALWRVARVSRGQHLMSSLSALISSRFSAKSPGSRAGPFLEVSGQR